MKKLALLFAFAAAAAPPPPPAKPARLTAIRVPLLLPSSETAPKISARLNGVDTKVLRLQNETSDLIVLLVLDLAGDLTLVDPARAALVEALNTLPPNTYVALLRAQDGLKVLHDPTNERQPLIEQIQGLSISGKAGLLDTVESVAEIADRMMSKARVRVAVFYVTDSNVGNYRQDFTNPVVNSSDSRDMSRRFPEGLIKEKVRQTLAGLLTFQPPLFLVHLNYQNDRLNEAYQTGLMELASATGGEAEFCRSIADIPTAIRRVVSTVVSHQTVELELKAAKKRQIDIQLTAEGQSLKYRTRLHLRGK